MTRIVIVIKHL